MSQMKPPYLTSAWHHTATAALAQPAQLDNIAHLCPLLTVQAPSRTVSLLFAKTLHQGWARLSADR